MPHCGYTPHVLVSGGGIAGNAAALALLRSGIRVTVAERASSARPGGQAVDLRGPSIEVAELLDLMPGIRRHQLHELGTSYVNARGREYATMPVEMFDGNGPVADVEITRGDLNRVLLDRIAATRGDLDYRYGERLEALSQDDTGVEVTFASGRTERFDLVIGADGIQSATRRLAFGPHRHYATFLGGYIAFFTIPTPPDVRSGWFSMYRIPGAVLGVRPDTDPDTAKAVIIVRAPADPALRRDAGAQQQLLRDLLGGAGWRASAVLEAMTSTRDFYFDELTRIDMPTLSAGRVTLAGDAGYCGSPLTGMGTATALVGAHILAGEIAAGPADLPSALVRYQRRVTPFLDGAKAIPGGGFSMMVPRSRFGIAAGGAALRIMTSRPVRPLLRKALSSATDGYELPRY